MKRVICLLLAIMMLLTLFSCAPNDLPLPEESESQTTKATEKAETTEPLYAVAEIQQPALTLFVGDSFELDYETHGEGTVRWYSTNACVEVEDGVVVAKAEGSAIVGGGGERLCRVRVLSETMPILHVQANGVAIKSKEEYVPCRISLDAENDQHDLTDLSAGIRVRGNSTSRRPKKPYRIKFDSKQNLLGMNNGAECKSWVLLAEYQDDSMVRTSSCLSLAEMILSEYSSDWRYVSLYIDGEYAGVYSLCEQSQINENRIDIEEAGAESDALASGYLFELDASPPHDGKISVSYLGFDITDLEGKEYKRATNDDSIYGLMRYSLKNDSYSDAQFAFASRYIQNVLKILYYATYEGVYYTLNEQAALIPSSYTSAEDAISAVIDIDSFVRMYIFSELICNADEYKKSFYMYVDFSEDGTGLLTFTCPWDFDGAIVAWNTYNYQDPNKYFAAKRNLWYVMAMKNDWFRDRVSEVWQALYSANDGFMRVPFQIRQITSVYKDAFSQDAILWDRKHDQGEHAEKTAKWFVARAAWMNSEFGAR